MKRRNNILRMAVIAFFIFTKNAVVADWEIVGKWPNGPCRAVEVDSNYVYMGTGGFLKIMDVTDPTNPTEVSSFTTNDAVENLFKSGNYDWCLFIGHLVLEKAFKGLWILSNKDINPPRTHNLLNLSKLAQTELEEDVLIFLNLVNTFHLEARYPEYKKEFYKTVSKEFAENNLLKIKELYQWLKSRKK